MRTTVHKTGQDGCRETAGACQAARTTVSAHCHMPRPDQPLKTTFVIHLIPVVLPSPG